MKQILNLITCMLLLTAIGLYADDEPNQETSSVKVNEIQMKGTHNSYHVLHDYHPYNYFPTMPDKLDLPWNYEHDSLTEQLEAYGVRSLELDIHYARGEFRVYHIYGLDDGSSCPNLDVCLKEIRDWSNAHPTHQMLFLVIESKDRDDPKDILLNRHVADHFAELEQTIINALGHDKIFTPSDLKGPYSSLHERVASIGWPTVDETRGKILLTYNLRGKDRNLYLKYGDNKASNLLMFLRVGVDEAFNGNAEKMDGLMTEVGSNATSLEKGNALVKKGYIVRVHSDAPQGLKPEQLKEQKKVLEAILASGAQLIVTNFPEESDDALYTVTIPDGTPSRCNPVNASDVCTSTEIEDLSKEH